MEPRLKSHIWVAAYLRRCAIDNIPAFITRHGDETSGTVLVKVNLLDGRARIFEAAYDDQGDRIWLPALKQDPSSEPEVDAFIARAATRDPDMWVVEIENRSGDARLDGL